MCQPSEQRWDLAETPGRCSLKGSYINRWRHGLPEMDVARLQSAAVWCLKVIPGDAPRADMVLPCGEQVKDTKANKLWQRDALIARR